MVGVEVTDFPSDDEAMKEIDAALKDVSISSFIDQAINEDDRANRLMICGALGAALTEAQKGGHFIESWDWVVENHQPTGQIDVQFGFADAPYRLSIERVTDDGEYLA
jgi:hypothetical protein